MCIRPVIHIRELLHIIRGTDVLDKARSPRDLALSNTIFYTFTNTYTMLIIQDNGLQEKKEYFCQRIIPIPLVQTSADMHIVSLTHGCAKNQPGNFSSSLSLRQGNFSFSRPLLLQSHFVRHCEPGSTSLCLFLHLLVIHQDLYKQLQIPSDQMPPSCMTL